MVVLVGMMRVVLCLEGELAYDIFLGGVFTFMRDVVRTLCTFLFFLVVTFILLYTSFVTFLLMTYIVLISLLYMMMYVVIHLSLHVLFLFSLYT